MLTAKIKTMKMIDDYLQNELDIYTTKRSNITLTFKVIYSRAASFIYIQYRVLQSTQHKK